MNTNKIELKINEKARSYAGIYASMIQDEYQRKRANAAIIALFAYADFLKKSNIDIQNAMTLYRNPKLCENYELADFYVNNYHVDVRVTTEEDKVLVPKIHYDYNIVPDFYVVIKTDKSLRTAEFLGVIDTSENKPEPSDFHYYLFNSNNFMSNDDFISQIISKKQIDLDENEHENFRDNYLGFIDNEIGNQTKIDLLRHLFKCSECRTEFCCFTGFEMVNCHASNYPELLTDKTLEIIGAQLVDDEKYEGKEETLYFDDISTEENILDIEQEDLPVVEPVQEISEINFNDENIQNVQNIQEETNSNEIEDNILDELFSDDEDTKEEIQIITDENNNDLPEIKENNSNLSSSEKVIIDYDEQGQPIYSYITDTGLSEIQNIDEPELLIEEDNQELNISEDDLTTVNNTVNESSEEIDIMDQMFVDGALEREKIEQSDISYNSLEIEKETPEKENIQIDTGNVEIKDNLKTVQKTELEEKEEVIQPEIVENQVEDLEVEQSYSSGSDEENSSQSYIVTKDEDAAGYDINNEEEINQKTPEDTEENEIIENRSISDDAQKNSSVQMFDGYIESEILKNSEDNDNDDDNENENEYEEYEDEGYDEEYYEKDYETPQKSSIKSLVITISIIAILLLALSVGAVFYLRSKNANDTNVSNEITKVEDNQNQENFELSNQNEEVVSKAKLEIPMMPSVDSNPPIIPDNEGSSQMEPPIPASNINKENNSDINKVIANALSSKNLVTLNGISWFCSAELYNDSAFKTYMQNLDNTFKQNLKNNIMQTTEIPVVNEVTLKFSVDNNRNLRKSLITESSGSDEIDKIVLQSLNETFEGEKSPILTDSPLKSDMYYFKVVIKL